MSGPSFVDCFQANAFQLDAFQTGFTIDDVASGISGGQFTKGRWRKIVGAMEAERQALADLKEAKARAKREAAEANVRAEKAALAAERARLADETLRQAAAQAKAIAAQQALAAGHGAMKMHAEFGRLQQVQKALELQRIAHQKAIDDDEDEAIALLLMH
jgi:hypothetical protein